MSETNENSAIQAMLSNYEQQNTVQSNNSYDKKNYFSTPLGENETSKVFKIRLLPSKKGDIAWDVVHLHEKEVDGKKRKFTCIKKTVSGGLTSTDCPFCEVREQLVSTGDANDKEESKKYNSREYYVYRVIDRDKEDEGVKFWRVPRNYKKEGVHDKIMALLASLWHEDKSINIFDAENGYDLNITVNKVTSNNGIKYPSITLIKDARNPSPVSNDTNLTKDWVLNSKDWTDVYSVKDYDYLKIVVEGGIPVYDKNQEKFVTKKVEEEDDSSDYDKLDSSNDPLKSVSEETSIDTSNSGSLNNENDDLPF
jgi:hypothetical protein